MAGVGSLPTCRNCEKRHRHCIGRNDTLEFVVHTTDRDSFRTSLDQNIAGRGQALTSDISSCPPDKDTTSLNSNEELYQQLVSCTAREALMHIKVSTLFRHYIDVLAPWYDLCDDYDRFLCMPYRKAIWWD